MRNIIFKIKTKILFFGFLLFWYPNIQAQITNNMPAIDLLGQYTTTAGFVNNYTQSAANNNNGSTYALGLSTPRDIEVDIVGHRLFVFDIGNNRVLVYNLDNNNQLIDKTPDFVLGQANFTTNTTGSTGSTLNTPRHLAYDATNKRLFVVDLANNRVLVFDVNTITNGGGGSICAWATRFYNRHVWYHGSQDAQPSRCCL